MQTKVLTQEEIKFIRSIQEKKIQLTEQFGVLEMRIQELLLQKEYLKEELENLQQNEFQLGQNLQQKYGEGTINLERGEFTSD